MAQVFTMTMSVALSFKQRTDDMVAFLIVHTDPQNKVPPCSHAT